jgi:ATP-dependent DNA helicase PIF1
MVESDGTASQDYSAVNALTTFLTRKPARPRQVASTSAETATILEAIHANHPVVVVLGRAGTGKTTLIRKLLAEDRAGQVVLAPTGVAAINVGGQTIHSFLRIPPRLHNLSEIQPRRGGTKLFKNLKRIIIDEISMVRADILDSINYALQINRKDFRPFGGVQVVLVGDFLQLPPVVRSDEERILANMEYETPYAFSAKCLKDTPVVQFELQTVHRQDDPVYVELLGNLRSGTEVQATVATFNATCHGPHKTRQPPIILTGTNAAADRHNFMGLKELSGDVVQFEGTITGEFNLEKDKLPAPELLALKQGSRIMMVKNDKAKNWVNGSLGTITRLGENCVWVVLDDDDEEYEIPPATWENIRYEWNETSQQIEAKVVGSFAQIPVIPAWALTIHKAQGLTLDNVRVDLTTGAFASGQAYVALSRARSLEGLSFVSPLRASDIIFDARLRGPRLAVSFQRNEA